MLGMLKNKEAIAVKEKEANLIADVRRVVDQMEATYSLFNMTSDHDMIEYFIHEINALDAHFRYLMRTVRQEGISCPPELYASIQRVGELS